VWAFSRFELMANYDEMPIAEVNRLIGERIKEIESKGLDFGVLGPLHPRAMLYVLDTMLSLAKA
jgi:hypothetical protein